MHNMGDHRGMFPTQGPNPPQYSDTTTSSSSSLGNTTKRTPLEQLRRYLIEIMGFTFDADFALLNKALGQTASCTCPPKSILMPEERAELLSLARSIKEAKAKVTTGSAGLTMRHADREAIAEAVLRPAHYVSFEYIGYLLEIISAYAVHQCEPTRRSFSLIWQKRPYLLTRCFAFLGPLNMGLDIFGQHLWAHAHVMGIVLPSEEVRAVLGHAMQVYQDEVLGMRSSRVRNFPFFQDDGWKEVAKALMSKVEIDEIRDERKWRERKEAEKNAKSAAKLEIKLL